MGQDADQAFLRLGLLTVGPQARAQEPLVTADGALYLPPVPIDAPVKPPGHLRPIPALGRRMGPSLVQGDQRGANAKLFAAQPVVVLGVVGGIGQQPVERYVPCGLFEGLWKLGRIVAGSLCDHHPGKQVRGGVADYGELGPPAAPKRPVAVAVHVVGAGVSGLQARGVDGPFGTLVDQSQLPCALETSSDKRPESPFFSSLFCA